VFPTPHLWPALLALTIGWYKDEFELTKAKVQYIAHGRTDRTRGFVQFTVPVNLGTSNAVEAIKPRSGKPLADSMRHWLGTKPEELGEFIAKGKNGRRGPDRLTVMQSQLDKMKARAQKQREKFRALRAIVRDLQEKQALATMSVSE